MSLEDVWRADENAGGRREGIYHVEVSRAEQKTSTNGNEMFNLSLIEVGSRKFVCYERLMIDGSPQSLGMTKAKLKCLGATEKHRDATDLLGLRAFVSVKLGKPDDEGRQFLGVDIYAKDSKCGYWHEASPPAGHTAVGAQGAMFAPPGKTAVTEIDEPPF